MQTYMFYPRDVKRVDVEFRFFGIRVSLPVTMFMMVGIILAIIGMVLVNKFVPEQYKIYLFIAVGVITLIFVLTVFWWVAKLSRMGPLPVEKQLSIIRETTRDMDMTNFADNDTSRTKKGKKK